MKHVLLLIVAGALLGGCALNAMAPIATILPEETYQGYPCFNTCEEFKKGFDDARSRQVESEDACGMKNINERTGCKAYVAEEKWRVYQQSDLYLE
jgi:hypothetical protein